MNRRGRRERVGTFRCAAYMTGMEEIDDTTTQSTITFDHLFRQHIDVIRMRARRAAWGTSADADDIVSRVLEGMARLHMAGAEITGAIVGRLIRQATFEAANDDGCRVGKASASRVLSALSTLEARGVNDPTDEEVCAVTAEKGEPVSQDLVRAVRLRPVSVDPSDLQRDVPQWLDEHDRDEGSRVFHYNVAAVHADIARLISGDRDGVDTDAPELLLELITMTTSPIDVSGYAVSLANQPRYHVRMFANADIAKLLGLTPRQVETRIAALRKRVLEFHTAHQTEDTCAAA